MRAGEQIFRRCARLDALHKDVQLPVVEPMVPSANRERIVRANLILAVFLRGRRLPVLVVVRGVWIHGARKQNRLAVGPPLGTGGARRHGRETRSLSAGQIEQVDLTDFVTLALCGEGNPPAVRRPRHVAFRRLRGGQASRLRAAI